MEWVIWVLLACMSLSLYTVLRVRNAPPLPEPEKLIMIKPVDQDDYFCSCPSCYWLGNHILEIKDVRFKAGLIRDEETVTLGTWQNPNMREISWPNPDGPKQYVQRTCYMCGHSWRTAVIEPKE